MTTKAIHHLMLGLLVAGAFTVGCREQEGQSTEGERTDRLESEKPVEVRTDDDATDPIENTIQEGVNEVQENTSMGGVDDN